MDVLKTDIFNFQPDKAQHTYALTDCRYPMVFKPAPVNSINDVKRKIELTQHQFRASFIHSQVAYCQACHGLINEYQPKIVVKEVMLDTDIKERVEQLHNKGNWVVCVDSSIDGALLRQGGSNNYSVIGFSTGKGLHGKYNLTITARKSIIEAIQSRLKARLYKAFKWDDSVLNKASQKCMEEAYRLDGVSLLKAINPKDYKINEFLAYVMTSLQTNMSNNDADLKVVIHLDSYLHWFENESFGNLDNTSYSRPDFLVISANIGEQKIKLSATVIECKMALSQNAVERKEAAKLQVNHGISRLKGLFNPASKSIKRRYWFAQLYRALAFSQITFCNGIKYQEVATQLRHILDGEFDIEWNGKVMGYWLDLDGDSENISIEDGIEVHNIPQKVIQRILLGEEGSHISYVPYTEDEYDEDIENKLSAPIKTKPNIQLSPITLEDVVQDGATKTEPANGVKVEQNDEPENEQSNGEDDDEPKDYAVTTVDLSNNKQVEPNNQAVVNEANTKLEDVRIYLGKDTIGAKVYWEFGNPHLANRHLLITGTSGQGKTYCIQTLLKELTDNNVSAAIFDYTEGFKKSQLEPEFIQALGEKIHQKVIYFTGVPINPFRRQEIEFDGELYPEKVSDVAQRIANIFKHVYDFGDQQFSAVYEACRIGMEQYKENMNMQYFKAELEKSKNSAAKTVLSKMAPFLNSVEFKNNENFDWHSIINSNGTITIFQLTNYVREIQVIITEMMLWDAWHYFTKNGNKNNPFVVVLDEAQNLSIKDNSPAQIILREGRKFGWSAWFATQSLKSLSDEEVINLHQAPFTLYFKPTDDEIIKIAKQIDPANAGSSENLVKQLQNLRKGQCIVAGDRIKANGEFGSIKPTVTTISSFKER